MLEPAVFLFFLKTLLKSPESYEIFTIIYIGAE